MAWPARDSLLPVYRFICPFHSRIKPPIASVFPRDHFRLGANVEMEADNRRFDVDSGHEAFSETAV